MENCHGCGRPYDDSFADCKILLMKDEDLETLRTDIQYFNGDADDAYNLVYKWKDFFWDLHKNTSNPLIQ